MMQKLSVIVSAFALVVLLSANAGAQGTSQDRGFVNINYGYQGASRTFADQGKFTLYDEDATFTASQSINKGGLLDLSAGARVWHNFAVGIGFSSFSKDSSATVQASIPSPLFFSAPRSAQASASSLTHTERAVHVQLLYMIPVSNKFDAAIFVGPSFFSVKQGVVSAVETSEVGPPYTSVAVNKVDTTDQSKSKVGVNAGIDLTYRFTRMAGVGVFVRYAGAKVDLSNAGGGTTSLSVGGFQSGVGLRLRF